MRKLIRIVGVPALIIGCTAFAAGPARAGGYVEPKMQHEAYGPVKIVVPISSPESKVWVFKLRNIANGLDAAKNGGGELQAEVVVYGPALKMLIDPDTELKAAIDHLRDAGVHITVCNNTLKGMNLDWHELYKVQEADVVPSGFLEVGWRGNHGWAVDPMN